MTDEPNAFIVNTAQWSQTWYKKLTAAFKTYATVIQSENPSKLQVRETF